MADTWGALPLPAPPVVLGQVAGDPLLTYLLPYLKTVVPAYLTSAWQTQWTAGSPPVPNGGIAPTRQLIAYTFAFDPSKHGFVDEKLPALYGWRDEEPRTEWLAADWTIDKSVITLLYVFEPHANPEVMRARQPMVNAIRKAVIHAIESERHPSWVVTSDPDPSAATRGSVLAHWAGFLELEVGRGKAGKLRVRCGANTSDFDTYEIRLLAKERQTIDPDGFDPNQGLEHVVETADGLALAHEVDS